MDIERDNTDNCIYFDVPYLSDGAFLPAEVFSVAFEKRATAPSVMRFTVKRDLNVKLESLTLSYRFSSKPIGEPDEKSRFLKFTYDSSNINLKEYISLCGNVPNGYVIEGCNAFISKITLAGGKVITFSPSDFSEPSSSETNVPDSDRSGSKTGSSDPDSLFGNADRDHPASGRDKTEGDENRNKGALVNSATTARKNQNIPKSNRRKRRRIILALTAVVCICGALACDGLYYYFHNDMTAAIDKLIKEERFTEAYKTAEFYERSDLEKYVCEKAVDFYLAENDLTEAYVYAYASPSGFSDEIAAKAFDMIISPDKTSIDKEALAVAKKITDDAKFDESMSRIAEEFADLKDYPTAMYAANSIRTGDTRAEISKKYFLEGINYYANNAMYHEAASFIHSYGTKETLPDNINSDTVNTIISHCVSDSDIASAIIVADCFNVDHSGITVRPGERSIREALSDVYPILTDGQKRSYHANKFTYYKEAFRIIDGVLEGTGITDAVSVDTFEHHTVVLHSDGRVTSLNNGGHNITETFPEKAGAVQIAAGLLHTVILYPDGTAEAVGDNTYGQCNVKAWTDIVSVAAGKFFTLGLRSDGTVVACGSNLCGQCDVSEYRNVIDIAACDQTAVMLFSDKTVHIQGDISMQLYRANSFTDVDILKAGGVCVIVKRSDGTFKMADGCIQGKSGSINRWGNTITDFACGEASAAYIDADNTVKFIGGSAPN